MRENKKSKIFFWKTANILKNLLNKRKTRKYCSEVKKVGQEVVKNIPVAVWRRQVCINSLLNQQHLHRFLETI